VGVAGWMNVVDPHGPANSVTGAAACFSVAAPGLEATVVKMTVASASVATEHAFMVFT
jgi:hypothetical protein